MSSQRLLVTVESESGSSQVALPGDIPIARLVPQLLEVCRVQGVEETNQWIVRRDGHLLPGNLTLEQAGVQEGNVLTLHDLAAAGGEAERPRPPTPEMETFDPGESTPASQPSPAAPPAAGPAPVALPRMAQLPERLRAMGEAMISPERDEPHVVADAGGSAGAHRLTIPRSPSALERAREAWRLSDYSTRLADLIAAPRLARCVTIAVVSPKGGVGKTTTAALLGTLFAMIRSDRVIAIDSNPDHGTLGRSLTAEHPIFVDDLLDVIDQPALTVTMLERFLGRGPHGLLVLPAPTDPERMERLDRTAYNRVIHRLQQLAGMLILDCGAGLYHPATRAAMETADQLVIVSDADPLTAGIVAEAARRLGDNRSCTVVVNKVPRSGSRLDMEGLVGEARSARGVIGVGADPEAAATVANGRFSWDAAPDDWQLAFRKLAAVLAADWQQLDLIA
jgi:MinD-like ATPase involved in chromosome partitioning or flagellar assembly